MDHIQTSHPLLFSIASRMTGDASQAEESVAARPAVHRSPARSGRPHLLMSEIRRVAADRLWMSMTYEQESVAIHFTWKREPEAVQALVAQIEEALAPFEARPHWGKVFQEDARAIAALYPRHADFLRLVQRLDP
jgi:hypothetical protein